MSSDTKYFTPSAGEIEIWMAKGERIEKIKAARIIILLNFMLYFKYFQKHVNIKLQLSNYNYEIKAMGPGISKSLVSISFSPPGAHISLWPGGPLLNRQ
jgi:hypothetical protein